MRGKKSKRVRKKKKVISSWEFLAINLARIGNMGVVNWKIRWWLESLTLGKETKEGKCI